MRAPAVHRALEAEVAAARRRRGAGPPRVLDVGGGSGGWAVPLARAGCAVTVVDTSTDALATLRRRAAEAGVADRVTAVQGDADRLGEVVAPGSADVVLGHGVLEVVDDDAVVAAALAHAAAPGGAVSVLVANRYAAVLARVLAGRPGDARDLLADPAGRAGAGDPLVRRYDTARLCALLAGTGLAVELVQGDGLVSELVPGGAAEGAPAVLTELELAAATEPPLRDVASRLHAVGRRPL